MIIAKQELARDRILKGWTQTDLVRRANVSHAIVSRAEHGHAISAKTAKKIADALGRDFEDVFELRI